MRKLLTLSIVALLTMFSTSAFAVLASSSVISTLQNRVITGFGEPLQTPDQFVSGQWYLIKTQYNKYDGHYIFDVHQLLDHVYIYASDGSDLIDEEGMLEEGLPLNRLYAYATRFLVGNGVTNYGDDDTYRMYTGEKRYYRMRSSVQKMNTASSNSSTDQVVYNINGEPGHFGFISTYTNTYCMCAATAPGNALYCWGNSKSDELYGPYDYQIIPITVSDEYVDDDTLKMAAIELNYCYKRLKYAYDNRFKEWAETIQPGGNIGDYLQEYIDPFKEEVEVIAAALNEGMDSRTADEWEELTEDLYRVTYELVENTRSDLAPADGYYRFIAAGGNYEGYGTDIAMYYGIYDGSKDSDTYADNNPYAMAYDVDRNDAAYLWKITNQGDDSYVIENGSNGYKFDILSASAYSTLSADGGETFNFKYADTADGGNNIAHITAVSSGLVLWEQSTYWYDGSANASYQGYMYDRPVWLSSTTRAGINWELEPVSDEEAEAIINGIILAHSCEAEFDHWARANATGGSFQLNTWSTEADESGMVTPFIEYWVGAGSTLPEDVIYHTPITGLTPGDTYQVSLFLRAFNENGGAAISAGTTFNVNDLSLDINAGTVGSYNGNSELYGTYTLFGTADEDGSLDINLSVANANYDWIAWKNLRVTSVSEIPALPAAAEGDMSTAVAEAQTAAIAAFEADQTPANYNAAIIAIGAAKASAVAYAAAAEEFAGHDASILENNEVYQAYVNKTMDATADVVGAIMDAYKAQPAVADMSYVVLNTTWTCEQGNGPGVYGEGTETYNGSENVAGKVMYQHIAGLQAGTYEVHFYAVSNNAWIGSSVGDGIAQVYANSTTEDITVNDQTSCTLSDYPHTLTAEVGEDGVLEYGIQNVANGGNWCVCQAISLTFLGEVEIESPVEDGMYIIQNVETGQYLGGGNTWGTHASVLPLPQQFTLATQEDGKYTLASYQYNGTKHFLGGTPPYVDSASEEWTIATTDVDGVYTIKSDNGYLAAAEANGECTLESSADATGTTWKLISMADIVASQAEATEENPVDVTGLIMNPGLSYNSQTTEVYWTVTSYDDESVAPSNYAFTSRAGSSPWYPYCDAESYHSSNGFNFHQTIEGLLAGHYVLGAQGFYRDDSKDGVTEGFPELYAGDAATTLPDLYSVEGTCATGSQTMTTAYTDFVAGLYPVSVEFDVENDGDDVTIGVRGNSTELWNIFAMFTLSYTGGPEGEVVTPEVGETVHECEAEIDHWSISSNGSSGDFHLNTWSTEADESGMVTPFAEYWVANGSVLSDATISHTQLTGLAAGNYQVSIDARIFAEDSSVTAISEGTTFNANSESVDLATGTPSSYNNQTEVYGTYTLLCEVGSAGTLDINFSISGANYNWIAFKNLKVIYEGAGMPDVEAVEGMMNTEVAAAQTAAIDAYNANKTTENYLAAVEAIAAAQASVDYYAAITAVVDALDEAGAAVWAATDNATAYAACTLNGEDVTADLAAAQKAQTTAGSDFSLVAQNDGAWTASQGNGPGTCPSRTTATETYNSADYAAGKVLSCTISGLHSGTYEITFYAQDNAANISGLTSGDGIAQVYANDATQDITVGTATACEYTDADIYTLTAVVTAEGTLEFGVQNVAAGGNWVTAEVISMTLVELSDDTETGINAAEASDAENGAIYTIQGIRVSNMSQPGIYIQNGKKILVK